MGKYRKYTKLDLIRYRKFANDQPKGLTHLGLVEAYDEEFPEVSGKDKLINLSKVFGLNNLHRAITGEDIPEDDLFFEDEDKL